jgi:hypothetical protein
MKENDYSIKPLQGLSNVSGLNPAKDGEGRKKRQKKGRRSPGEFVEPELDGLSEHDIGEMTQNDDRDHRIDYCA